MSPYHQNATFLKRLNLSHRKTIPLENIQDLSFYGGPVLRSLGLTLIRIETAGGGGGHHNNNIMSMLGINDAENFKLDILNQREKVMKEKYQFSSGNIGQEKSILTDDLLKEIKNELVEIKLALKK